jgi:hypothetical protein
MVEREREVDLPLKPVLYHYTKIQVVVRMLLSSLGRPGPLATYVDKATRWWRDRFQIAVMICTPQQRGLSQITISIWHQK